ncbi:MAG: hypothetical protein Q7U98_05775 [Methylicorpusculum sp.]|nr:hypothetical protein [Methylicorpusculum sp.]MDO8843282.1 hypothetical protein [Methylicorpusculum sp.]MDO8938648.1 hypothetical protein [Methylicorpusculum sp.]MDO9240027.1 hypothetical protein [Methylicorpusculum sp.]MDP2179241.1 hypothetical protein [Methylicorpusculum sp.]MDP2204326.1 hypothetical protein [Methylicorpusculum sp.]
MKRSQALSVSHSVTALTLTLSPFKVFDSLVLAVNPVCRILGGRVDAVERFDVVCKTVIQAIGQLAGCRLDGFKTGHFTELG